LFLPKPTTHLRFDEIASCEFARVSKEATNKTFDLILTLKNGTIHQFGSIGKQEYSPLYNFINSKKISIKLGNMESEPLEGENETHEQVETEAIPNLANLVDEDDSSSDEEFEPKEEGHIEEDFSSDFDILDEENQDILAKEVEKNKLLEGENGKDEEEDDKDQKLPNLKAEKKEREQKEEKASKKEKDEKSSKENTSKKEEKSSKKRKKR